MSWSEKNALNIGATLALVIVGSVLLSVVRLRAKRRVQDRSDALFLGFDFSTQSLTTIIIGTANNVETDKRCRVSTSDGAVTSVNDAAANEIMYFHQLSYDEQFPEFHTTNGVIHSKRNEVLAPSLMFIAALEKSLSSIPISVLHRVKAVSGSGQQHGTIFWRRGFDLSNELSQNADNRTLSQTFVNAFALENGPIWMDSSTGDICREVEKAIGGGDRVAALTGSRAYERFSGNQICKVLRSSKETSATMIERVTLVSSGMASVLAGKYVQIDHSDGSGMNLMDLQTREWSASMLETYSNISNISVQEWKRLLGPPPLQSHTTCVGKVHPYFTKRLGLNDAEVISFSGDNPCTVAGLNIGIGDVAISLGTSTTLFALTTTARPSGSEGHVFRSPLDDESFMVMICFKNGALPRDDVCRRVADASWDSFNNLLEQGLKDSHRLVTVGFLEPEITPTLREGFGYMSFIFNQESDRSFSEVTFDELPPPLKVASLIEGQCLALRHHSKVLGIQHPPRRLIVTGGASQNKSIIQVLSNVFQCPIFTSATSVTNTAALGAAFRAREGWLEGNGLKNKMTDEPQWNLLAIPQGDLKERYERMLDRFTVVEDMLKIKYGVI